MNRKVGLGGTFVDLYPQSDYDPTQWERACVTVDTCICRVEDHRIQVLLSKRNQEPFNGYWGFPGGFVDIAAGETLDQAASRTLQTKTGATGVPIRQLGTYGQPLRDPRWRIITIVYYALVSDQMIDGEVVAGLKHDPSDLEHRWFELDSPPDMAFDHAQILGDLRCRLREGIRQSPIAFELVPPEFTWTQLMHVYESILDNRFAAGNFRRDILRIYDVQALARKEDGKGKGKGRTGVLLKFLGKKSNL